MRAASSEAVSACCRRPFRLSRVASQRARLGPRGVRLGRVEQPRVHAVRRRRRGRPAGSTRTPAAAPGAPPRAPSATSRRRRARPAPAARRPGRRGRCARRTAPPWRGRRAPPRPAAGPATVDGPLSSRATPCSRSADAGVARPPELGVRRPTPRRPACAAAPAPAAASGSASAPARAARSRPAPRRRRSGRPRPSRTSASDDAEPSSTARGVGAPQQGLGGRLRRRTTQPAVAQHHVDAVAGRRERRRHALQRRQPGQRVVGMAHGRERYPAGTLERDEHRPSSPSRPAPSAGSRTPTTAAARPTRARPPSG